MARGLPFPPFQKRSTRSSTCKGSETVGWRQCPSCVFALKLWERGDAILQADGEGFTNEEGYHIVWQFSDSVSGPCNMGVLQDGVWRHFSMDLGDPDHRAAFLRGSVCPTI